MITSFEVGAVFRILDEASPALRKILAQIRSLRAELDKTKLAMSEFMAFKPPPGLTTAIGKTDELALSWKGVTEQASRANAAMAKAATVARGAYLPASAGAGGNRGVFRPGARGGGGAHIGGPGIPIAGGGHVRFGGGAAAAAGVLGYGVYEAAQMEDAVWQLIYHSGQDQKDPTVQTRMRGVVQRAMIASGYNVHDVGEAALQEIRMFQGTPGRGIDILPDMLEIASKEARAKGSSLAESMKSFIGLSHMTQAYGPEEIKKLAPAFAYMSVANPTSLSSIEKAAGYAVPLMKSGLGIDPMDSLLLGTVLTRAGATSTKSGTWLREMALRAMPGTSMMSKIAYKKHEEALKAFGLVDDSDKPTWFTDGKPDIMKMLDIAGGRAGSIPIEKRAAFERALFGAQGGGGFALLSDPAVREQIGNLRRERDSPEFQNRYRSFLPDYAAGSTVQAARTTLQEFNTTMMDLGKIVLPSVNQGLRDMKSILEKIRGLLPSANSGAIVGARTLEGAGVGAAWGVLGGPLGIGGGAIAGGAAGLAAGWMQEHGGVGIDRGGSYTSPGKTGKPAEPKVLQQNTTLQLNIDGRTFAEAIASKLVDLMKFDTSSPAFNGSSLFGN